MILSYDKDMQQSIGLENGNENTGMKQWPTHHSNLEAGDDTGAAKLGVGGPVRELVHHPSDFNRGPAVSCFFKGEGVAQTAGGAGRDKGEDPFR